ncbi:response regulator [Phenylobacterium soli]|uniref:Response regulator n=1 Tax=Phenylobacterium soli TaxID=2170551 RepID=A0A328AM56_9CAUL|nr:response regulator [Phenylobacterium soli]RAK55511.1 response regulator [Phenylobacterium soli]
MAAAAARFVQVSRRLLVVDDDNAICELLADILSEEGFALDCVGTDREAFARLTDVSYDGLVLDVNLGPGVTGFDVARFARSLRSDFPVVYISGEASRASFKTFGVPGSTFVAKPFSRDELLDAVEIAIADE